MPWKLLRRLPALGGLALAPAALTAPAASAAPVVAGSDPAGLPPGQLVALSIGAVSLTVLTVVLLFVTDRRRRRSGGGSDPDSRP